MSDANLRNSEIARVRARLVDGVQRDLAGILKDPGDLRCSDHIAVRLVERKLQHEVPFIVGIAGVFMRDVFYQTTYEERTYTVQLRDLKVGISVHLGKTSKRRFAIISTAFKQDSTYMCDETIVLK